MSWEVQYAIERRRGGKWVLRLLAGKSDGEPYDGDVTEPCTPAGLVDASYGGSFSLDRESLLDMLRETEVEELVALAAEIERTTPAE